MRPLIYLAAAVGATLLVPLHGAAAQAGGAHPADAERALERLNASPRHGDWVTVRLANGDSVRSWIVHPERSDPAPVVVVVHEIYGLTHWVRAVADQLAAEGFIAVAPDLLTMRNVPRTPGGEPERDPAVAAVRALDGDGVHAQIRAVAEHVMAMPAARAVYGIVGYCWGGSTSFAHATRYADLGGAVVYYGGAPEADALARVRTPVLGLYGGDDARVNATIPRAEEALPALYMPQIFDGAGHGFLRQQDARDGANLRATERAWPMTVGFFHAALHGGR
ncbi:MAG TPA: dienelactone hydrolase family protein [Longimicrobiales bacterium]|nr:dienelactone hydrolase family protein [Longimicrobiales bacterium]